MDAMIDSLGKLSLRRHGQWKEQECPFTADHNDTVLCGDWCPLFDEYEHTDSKKHKSTAMVHTICASWNVAHEVVKDERKW